MFNSSSNFKNSESKINLFEKSGLFDFKRNGLSPLLLKSKFSVEDINPKESNIFFKNENFINDNYLNSNFFNEKNFTQKDSKFNTAFNTNFLENQKFIKPTQSNFSRINKLNIFNNDISKNNKSYLNLNNINSELNTNFIEKNKYFDYDNNSKINLISNLSYHNPLENSNSNFSNKRKNYDSVEVKNRLKYADDYSFKKNILTKEFTNDDRDDINYKIENDFKSNIFNYFDKEKYNYPNRKTEKNFNKHYNKINEEKILPIARKKEKLNSKNSRKLKFNNEKSKNDENNIIFSRNLCIKSNLRKRKLLYAKNIKENLKIDKRKTIQYDEDYNKNINNLVNSDKIIGTDKILNEKQNFSFLNKKRKTNINSSLFCSTNIEKKLKDNYVNSYKDLNEKLNKRIKNGKIINKNSIRSEANFKLNRNKKIFNSFSKEDITFSDDYNSSDSDYLGISNKNSKDLKILKEKKILSLRKTKYKSRKKNELDCPVIDDTNVNCILKEENISTKKKLKSNTPKKSFKDLNSLEEEKLNDKFMLDSEQISIKKDSDNEKKIEEKDSLNQIVLDKAYELLKSNLTKNYSLEFFESIFGKTSKENYLKNNNLNNKSFNFGKIINFIQDRSINYFDSESNLNDGISTNGVKKNLTVTSNNQQDISIKLENYSRKNVHCKFNIYLNS